MSRLRGATLGLLLLCLLAGCQEKPRTVSLPDDTFASPGQARSSVSAPGKTPLSGAQSRKIKTH